MRARQILDTEEWDMADHFAADVPEGTPARHSYDFVTAYAALKRGRADAAKDLLARHGTRREAWKEDAPRARIEEMELQALLAVEDGDPVRAVALLREASTLEESLPFEFGPPASLKPPHELLGEVLLEDGQAAEAMAAFQAALARTPGRTLDLMGLAISAGEAGHDDVAADADAKLRQIWASAEPSFRDRIGG